MHRAAGISFQGICAVYQEHLDCLHFPGKSLKIWARSMAAEMALVGHTRMSNNGEGFAFPFPQILQADCTTTGHLCEGNTMVTDSVLQLPAAITCCLILHSAEQADWRWSLGVKRFPCPCSTAEAPRERWPECRAGGDAGWTGCC